MIDMVYKLDIPICYRVDWMTSIFMDVYVPFHEYNDDQVNSNA
jgi:hypothetical protein